MDDLKYIETETIIMRKQTKNDEETDQIIEAASNSMYG